jgi:hypothetical protein
MALFSIEQMKGLDFALQEETFEKFITHPLVRNMIPYYLKDLDSVKHSLEIVNNFKSSVTTHLLGFRKIEFMVTEDKVCTLAFNQYVNNSRGVAKMLGLDKQNIKKTMSRRVQLNTIHNFFWIKPR